jgi:2,3-bisphosphoglycerate-independent phosphoglycerate mutase
VNDGDAVIFYNYRNDRPKELTKAFTLDSFDDFNRGPKRRLYFVTMTSYDIGQPLPVAYPRPGKLENTLGQYISDLGLRQFRCAETEKFPHVTFFFNDGREEPFPGEDRQIIPSPKDVTTYDQKPQMSAQGVADEVVKRIDSGIYDLIVVNFANADMVGHTGNLQAAIKAAEFVDARVGQIMEAVRRQNGAAIIFADHGNCEQMIDPATGAPHTAHTIYDVDLIVADDRFKGTKLHSGGRLADVAPTALRLMGLPQPPQMSGKSLVH